MINPLYCFFGSQGLLRLIQRHLLNACPLRQFQTVPGLLDSRAALSNSYPNAREPNATTYHVRGGHAHH